MNRKEVILKALRNLRNNLVDDLTRYEIQIRNNPHTVDKKYMESGNTLRELLEYQQSKVDELDDAIRWANTL